MDRLHGNEVIADPVRKGKNVALTDDGPAPTEAAFRQQFDTDRQASRRMARLLVAGFRSRTCILIRVSGSPRRPFRTFSQRDSAAEPSDHSEALSSTSRRRLRGKAPVGPPDENNGVEMRCDSSKGASLAKAAAKLRS